MKFNALSFGYLLLHIHTAICFFECTIHPQLTNMYLSIKGKQYHYYTNYQTKLYSNSQKYYKIKK